MDNLETLLTIIFGVLALPTIWIIYAKLEKKNTKYSDFFGFGIMAFVGIIILLAVAQECSFRNPYY